MKLLCSQEYHVVAVNTFYEWFQCKFETFDSAFQYCDSHNWKINELNEDDEFEEMNLHIRRVNITSYDKELIDYLGVENVCCKNK